MYATNTKVTVMGPRYSSRETLYRNGSLLIHNVTQKDIGFYTLRTLNSHGDTMSTSTFLHVNRKWFFVNSGYWVVVVPLTYTEVSSLAYAYLYSTLYPILVFEHLLQDTTAIDQNLSFDLSLK